MASILADVSDSEALLFKKKLAKLEKFRGRGTEMISVYIPPDTDRGAVMGQLNEEISQSSNIKSPQTRKNVQGALRKISGFLKQINFKLPPTGLVVFAGNVSESEGKTDIRLFTIKPIKELRTRLYWCDSQFHLEPLREMAQPQEVYGLITIDKNEATIAALIGKRYDIIGKFTSGVAGKTRAGGQCLEPNTLVLLENGQEEKILELKVSQLIKSINISNNSIMKSEITQKWDTNKKQIKITTEKKQNMVVSSPDHVFFIFNKKTGAIEEKIAKKLKTSDLLLTLDKTGKKLKPIQIKKMEKIDESIPMVDISVEKQNFFANGLLVHNSAKRFEHLREEAAQEFYKRISEKANAAFLPYEDKLKGMIIGGPGITKNYFLEKDLIDYRLKKKVIGTVDTSYTDESGIREILQRSDEILKATAVIKEKKLLERFFTELAKDSLASYGEKQVIGDIEIGKVDTLLLSEGINWIVLKFQCQSCSKEFEVVVKSLHYSPSKEKCTECSSTQLEVLEEAEYLEYMVEKAATTGAKVEIISTDTPEGQQFLKSFEGIGAILRFK